MKRTNQFLAITLIAISAIACKNTDFKKTKEGFPYKVYSDGKGEKIMPGYVVRYHMTNKLEDSLMSTTYGNPAQWMAIPKQGDENPMTKLLLEARKGDSILVMQPVDSIMKKDPRAAQDSFLMAHKGKQFKAIIKVVEVYKDETAAQGIFEKEATDNFYKDPANSRQRKADEAEIDNYLKSKGITATRTPWGAYVQTVSAGNGQKAKMGQFMMLKYTGKDFAGKVFDTNDKPGGQLMPLQVGAGGTITGFQDGVKTLSKGEKAIIYIPSVIAYGAEGSPPAIQPNQNILFEIEVVDISDKQPAPPRMPQADTTRR
ncbi:MAG TPA: FKBP-type peptidyl-prolyl cis-trans isomerase [Flavisolibacter sp.]|jgi:FKBP-type peptidyl-prolyl cis-trans isomerase|nr:FKBP-type peptidyl-prolyl cis-trans isomerase [Flavisolibacter sp.]